ncbi:hypothetical protein PINS_up003166 [Pythium insidiosum]|nr:hypothetical protein PINS_up003166 [Pythium insidiosum]
MTSLSSPSAPTVPASAASLDAEKAALLARAPPAVPYALLALYFLHSFFMTFPMTAYGKWLFEVIHMAPATTTIYYAVTFFPWNLKPLYGLISDVFPIAGFHRKSYIVICELGTALSFIVTGAFVTTIAGAFAIKMLDAICEAFSQMMLGIFLVDIAAQDATSQTSAKVQSWANGAKKRCIDHRHSRRHPIVQGTVAVATGDHLVHQCVPDHCGLRVHAWSSRATQAIHTRSLPG